MCNSIFYGLLNFITDALRTWIGRGKGTLKILQKEFLGVHSIGTLESPLLSVNIAMIDAEFLMDYNN